MKLFGKKKELETVSMDKGVRLITVSSPTSNNAEQFNTVRTNIQFSTADEEYSSIMLTSSAASEGKSTVAGNLAISFARQGKKTILVDADLRRPTIQSTFAMGSGQGLTNYLTEKNFDINQIVFKTTIKNLFVIPSGPVPPNPSELLGSNKMKTLIKALQSQVDIVIYDAPPVLSVPDAQILSTRMDGSILVVRANKTEKEAVDKMVKLINHVGGKIIGTILNDVKDSNLGYYGYGYYGKDTKK